MNILDENIREDQRLDLLRRRLSIRQIGVDLKRKGRADEEIITLLYQLDRPTFFTQDQDFYSRRLCHERYCIVYLDIDDESVSEFFRRFLRHPAFDSKAKRMRLVVRVEESRVTVWRQHQAKQIRLSWK